MACGEMQLKNLSEQELKIYRVVVVKSVGLAYTVSGGKRRGADELYAPHRGRSTARVFKDLRRGMHRGAEVVRQDLDLVLSQ